MAMNSLHILDAQVMHHRLFPADNKFAYRLYYLLLPLDALERGELDIAVNRFAVHSFYYKDHGYRDSRAPSEWLRYILKKYDLEDIVDLSSTLLVTLPRLYGYVFNPVSFWLCHDKNNQLCTVIYEVNNTFGETHSYISCAPNHGPIEENTILTTQKLFHVSPFLEREGRYTFRFKRTDKSLGIWIDFFDESGRKKLLTSLTGQLSNATKADLDRFLKRMPLVTLKSILLIHWQAIVLLYKGIKYIHKPNQKDIRDSSEKN